MPANGQPGITHKPLNKPGPQHDTPRSRILEMGLRKIQNKQPLRVYLHGFTLPFFLLSSSSASTSLSSVGSGSTSFVSDC